MIFGLLIRFLWITFIPFNVIVSFFILIITLIFLWFNSKKMALSYLMAWSLLKPLRDLFK
jgi:hypothetical protein